MRCQILLGRRQNQQVPGLKSSWRKEWLQLMSGCKESDLGKG